MSASAVMAPPSAPAPTPRFASASVAAAAAPAHPSTPRRPSPWHDIAPLVPSPPVALPRRGSAPALAPPQYTLTPSNSTPHSPPTLPSAPAPAAPPPPTPIPHAASTPPIPSAGSASGPTPYDSDDSAPASVTSSQALRDWERLIAAPDNDITRHALIPLPSSAEGSPQLGPAMAGVVAALPKLAAERDKEGHIEYKLKLIEPSPERFERLVTQMMWRLKQGRNEAIYELGLADDGTVIGLTRAEMDASLATLERMASEVGATVLVLKEIVLAAPPEGTDPSTAAARRPDLDEHGRPRKGTRGLNGVGAESKSRRERLRARREAEAAAAAAAGLGPEPLAPRRGARSIIFDQAVGSDSDDDAGGTETNGADADVDDDGAQFALDMDDDASVAPRPAPRTRSVAAAATAPDAEAEARAEAKRRKSAARREARRLDLLRGDGTASLPYAERSRSPVAEFIGHAPAIATHMRHMLPHQPMRPSTLRLGTVPRPEGASGSTSPTDAGATPDDAFLDGLALPLDSLSLSFADVHSASTSPTQPSMLAPAGNSAFGLPDSKPAGPAGTAATHTLAPLDTSPPGEELICVEALVVRKPHGDEWEYGGHDDGWGFGARADDDEDDGGVAAREDDPWGFDDDDE